MSKRSEEQKYIRLLESLGKMDRVVVAFSGGIDSTLLLYAAIESLGPIRVTAVTAVSEIVPSIAAENCRKVFNTHFSKTISLNEITADPLKWENFTENDKNRCYLCKKNLYSQILQLFCKQSGAILLDGTNFDDLSDDRPGYAALQELEIPTPLANAKLKKTEIRYLAREFGLINFAKPSNSCLATRISRGTPLDLRLLEAIDEAERFLFELGFDGCRVRPMEMFTLLEVQETDFQSICARGLRRKITDRFKSLHLNSVALSFIGRKG
jgi:uncharacterized protein